MYLTDPNLTAFHCIVLLIPYAPKKKKGLEMKIKKKGLVLKIKRKD